MIRKPIERFALLTGHTNLVASISFSPDGGTLASGGYDGTIRLWDAETGALKQTIRRAQGVEGVVFSPDGSTFATGSGVSSTLHLWDAETGEHKQQAHGTYGLG